jgi:hypothetical protein
MDIPQLAQRMRMLAAWHNPHKKDAEVRFPFGAHEFLLDGANRLQLQEDEIRKLTNQLNAAQVKLKATELKLHDLKVDKGDA